MQLEIRSFSGPCVFLSNFYLRPITYGCAVYPSVEHAYQACKTTDDRIRALFRNPLLTPAAAKQAGRKLTLRAHWDEIKLDFMEDLLRIKFSEPDLRRALLATRTKVLIEGNWWHDTFWGVCERCQRHHHTRPIGENNLGILLMKVRDTL